MFRNHVAETAPLNGHLVAGFASVIEFDRMTDESSLGCEDREQLM
jgi:hypothetical protein